MTDRAAPDVVLPGRAAAGPRGAPADAPRADTPKADAPPIPTPPGEHAFVLQVVQPGLLGLMDGSVSTLAPIFAAARLTGRAHDAFFVGLAASVGAAISMGLAEALSDDGRVSGRGSPLIRGGVTGAGTLLGGMGHTMPFLIHDLRTALYVAYGVVVAELLAIAYIRYHFMESPLGRTVVQVIVGGGIVLLVGIWLGTLGAAA